MTTAQRHEFDNFDNFVSKCKKYVNNIRNYSGDDPLQPWYEYLMWFEENFVVDFEKNTPFEDVLADCLSRFENSEQYKQDRRLIKLFIKFVSNTTPIEIKDRMTLQYPLEIATQINRLKSTFIPDSLSR